MWTDVYMHVCTASVLLLYGQRHLLQLVASEKSEEVPREPITPSPCFDSSGLSTAVYFGYLGCLGKTTQKGRGFVSLSSRASRTDKRWTQDRYWADIHVAPTTVEIAKHKAPTSCRQSIDSCTPSKQDAVEWLIADPKSGVNDLDGAIQVSTTAASCVAACFYGFRYVQYHSQQDLQSVRCCRTYSRAIS